MKQSSGQVTVFIALAVPFLAALLLSVVNFGLLVDSKIRLQIAADRAVYAGAAKLSQVMNEIAKDNWAIYKSFNKVDQNADYSSWQSGECQNRVNELKNNQSATLASIDDLRANGYRDANIVAENVAKENYGSVNYAPLFGEPGRPLFQIVDWGKSTDDEKNQYDGSSDSKELIAKNIICGNVSGIVFDPDDVKTNDNANILKYTYKNAEYVGLISKLSAKFNAPLLSNVFGSFNITATAAAQPYGGSIKRFALLAESTSSVDEAVEQAKVLAQDGKPYWFRPALVPVTLAAGIAKVEITGEESYLQ